MKKFDVVIIGAGHNALVSAAYLARAGKSILVLERRKIPGGFCVTEELSPGIQVNSIFPGGFLRPDIVKQLGLTRFGLPQHSIKTSLVSLLPGASQINLSNDVKETAASVSSFSKMDAQKWGKFTTFMNRAASFLEAAYQTPMPRLPNFSLTEGLPLAQLGLGLRAMGAKDMYAIIRLLPMSVREFLDEWFESDQLKAVIATLGIYNANLGVMSAGSAYNFLHQYMLRGGWGQPQNPKGVGQIPTVLSEVSRSRGVELRTQAEVVNILVKDGQINGVLLSDGEQITTGCVVSSLDPRRTFLSLVAPEHLNPEFIRQVQNIKMRGVSSKVHLAVDDSLVLPAGTIAIAPTLNYLERAYDAAKYGQISAQPYLEATQHAQVVSIHMQFTPYHLKATNWDEITRKQVESLAVETLAGYLPDLKSKINSAKTITPLDFEKEYSLTEGDPNHGQLMLDQFLFMRPLPGWSNHQTPLAGLYLCGSAVHGGGGISGIPGRNAARKILQDGYHRLEL